MSILRAPPGRYVLMISILLSISTGRYSNSEVGIIFAGVNGMLSLIIVSSPPIWVRLSSLIKQ